MFFGGVIENSVEFQEEKNEHTIVFIIIIIIIYFIKKTIENPLAFRCLNLLGSSREFGPDSLALRVQCQPQEDLTPWLE